MTNRLAASIFILLMSVTTAKAADDIVGPLRTQWGITRDLVVNLVQIMPEEKYDFKPTPAIRSFREVVGHLILENYTFMSMVTGDPAPDKAKFEVLKSRDELTKALSESYAFGERALAALTDAKAVEKDHDARPIGGALVPSALQSSRQHEPLWQSRCLHPAERPGSSADRRSQQSKVTIALRPS
jgi:hypothetical protein